MRDGGGAAARSQGFSLEEVGTFVERGTNKIDMRLWSERVAVADEGDEGGFAAGGSMRGGVRAFLCWLFAVIIVAIVVFVIRIVFQFSSSERTARFFAARTAVGVVKYELAAAENGFCGGLADGVLLLALAVKGAHVAPQFLLYTNNVVKVFDHWGAEVDGEVPAIVITTGVPALVTVVLVGLFVVL